MKIQKGPVGWNAVEEAGSEGEVEGESRDGEEGKGAGVVGG